MRVQRHSDWSGYCNTGHHPCWPHGEAAFTRRPGDSSACTNVCQCPCHTDPVLMQLYEILKLDQGGEQDA